MDFQNIAKKFNIAGDLIDITPITAGHINVTTKLTFNNNGDIKSYIIQKMNVNVFKKPIELIDNIKNVTDFIRAKLNPNDKNYDRLALTLLRCVDGNYYFIDENNDFYRIYDFIYDSLSFNLIDDLEIIEESGKAFGAFQKNLKDYDASTLSISIPDFHNTINRYRLFKEAIKNDKYGRLNEVKDIVDEYLSLETMACKMSNMLLNGELPLRVTHNDTKCNNVLFDKDTRKALAVIDLDTVMPGLAGFDFGDAIRTGAVTANEDEHDLSKMNLDLNKFEAFTKGFVSEVKDSLTENEFNTFALGCFNMACECGVRFITDYLDGDTYFQTHYDKQNVYRAKTQLKLSKDIIEKMPLMNEIIKKYL